MVKAIRLYVLGLHDRLGVDLGKRLSKGDGDRRTEAEPVIKTAAIQINRFCLKLNRDWNRRPQNFFLE
jgi:hypothetical protein